jgi:peroxiredoxin
VAHKLNPWQIAGIALLAAFTLFITWRLKTLERRLSHAETGASLTGKMAPDFSLASLDGQNVALADYKGKKKLVLSYWASWCGPCRLEMPSLKDFYEKYHHDDSDFELLAISIDDNRGDAESYATKEKLPFPVLLDLQSKVADAYSVNAIPTVFVIDRDGKVIFAHTGFDQMLEFQLAQKLGIELKVGDAQGKGEK